MKDTRKITAEKDEFSDWFTQIMLKADLSDYTEVSGAMVFKPRAFAIWENIKEEVDKGFKNLGIRNCYFPLLIPEKILRKEQEHVEGFVPEVAWVTHAGDTQLNERLAIRPTSETIMYASYAKWIRSWRDLPLKLNQWNNVIRWEFKHPVPFLRTREFLWNEGHTVYATKEEAETEKDKIIKIYDEVCREFLALPSLIGRKSEKEKFAGAVYTISMEFLLPNGRAIQGPDFHFDGQNFAKAYGIKFLDRDGKEKHAWQNTFAISTRMLGVMFAMHSDSKGLVLPPRITPKKIVIVPIYFDDSKEKVMKFSRDLENKLKKFGAFLDSREEYRPGHKFAEWELKGIPLRIEVGPKEVEKQQAVLIRRDDGKKEIAKLKDIRKKADDLLRSIQENLLNKATRHLQDGIVKIEKFKELERVVKNKKIAFAPICNSRKCEDGLKSESGGAKILNIPEKQPKNLSAAKCFFCDSKADYFAYVGKSY